MTLQWNKRTALNIVIALLLVATACAVLFLLSFVDDNNSVAVNTALVQNIPRYVGPGGGGMARKNERKEG